MNRELYELVAEDDGLWLILRDPEGPRAGIKIQEDRGPLTNDVIRKVHAALRLEHTSVTLRLQPGQREATIKILIEEEKEE